MQLWFVSLWAFVAQAMNHRDRIVCMDTQTLTRSCSSTFPEVYQQWDRCLLVFCPWFILLHKNTVMWTLAVRQSGNCYMSPLHICKCLPTCERNGPLLSDHVRQWVFYCGESIALEILKGEVIFWSFCRVQVCGLEEFQKSLFSWRRRCFDDGWRLRLFLMDLSFCVFSCLSERCQSFMQANKRQHTSCCFKRGCLVSNRTACVLGGACQRQHQPSSRSKMAGPRTAVKSRDRRPLLDASAAWISQLPWPLSS